MIPIVIWNRQTSGYDARSLPIDDEAGRDPLQADTLAIVEAMVRAVPDPFIVLDATATIIFHNDPARELSGQTTSGA